jgi:SAM-dependent methyltransferase
VDGPHNGVEEIIVSNTTASPGLAEIFDLGVPVLAAVGAQRGGLLDALLEAPGSPEELAATLGLDPVATRLVLNVLTHCGAVVWEAGRYDASPALRDRARDAPGGVGLHLALLGHIPKLLAEGKPLLEMDGTLEERGRYYAQVAAGLGRWYKAAAAELAQALEAEPYRSRWSSGRVLDLGAGSGVWSLAIAVQRPEVHVTAVDLPPVLEGLRENAEDLGLGSRVTLIGTSYFADGLPDSSCDVAILANVLHLETTVDAELLVRRAGAAVRPGGTVVVVDILGSGSYETDPTRAMYALFLATRTARGHMYARAEVEGWLVAAGLTDARSVELPSAPSHFSCLAALRPQ